MLTAFLVLAVLFASVIWLYPAVRFIRLTKKGTYSPSSRFAAGPLREVPQAGTPIRLYGDPENCTSTLVMLPGLHPNGIDDPRYQAFAQTCACAGFLVVAPDIQAFREFRIDPQTVDQLSQLIESLPEYVNARALQNLGLFGVSYAAGIAFLIAARKPEKINFLVSVGGHCDLSRTIEFGLTGFHPDRKRIASQPRQEWIRMIFALNFAEKLIRVEDREPFLEIMLLRLNLNEQKAKEMESSLSEEAKRLLHQILHGIPENEAEPFRVILRSYAEFFRNLSPQQVQSKLDPQLRVLLLHGKTDDLIPYEETLMIQKRLSGHPHVRTCVTSSLTHVDVKGAQDLFGAIRLLLGCEHCFRKQPASYIQGSSPEGP